MFINLKTTDMGKGDKKTRRGKLFMGSFGKKRPKKQESFKSASTEKVVKDQETKPVRKHVAEAKETKAPKAAEAKPVREKKEDKPEAKKEAPRAKKEKKAE
jgi:30S ribosomal protein S31